MRTRQLSLLPKDIMNTNVSFGGSLRTGERKIARPLSSKNPIHLVIKSSMALGMLSFPNNRKTMDNIIKATAKKWGITLMDHKWNWTHLHAIIQVPNRTIYNNWIRELTGAIVQYLSKKTGLDIKRFFDHRPFTRVLHWGKDLKNAYDYLILNEMELFGCRPPKKKGKKNSTIKRSAKRPAD